MGFKDVVRNGVEKYLLKVLQEKGTLIFFIKKTDINI
jgi:hypothetical protein